MKAKFVLEQRSEHANGWSLTFRPVTAEEAPEFFAATPAGQLHLDGLTAEAAGELDVGQTVVVSMKPERIQ